MRLHVLAAVVAPAALVVAPAALVVAPAALVVAQVAEAGAGGTPASQRSGGVPFGSPLPVPDRRPIARRLSVSPQRITAGEPAPQVALRVRQRGVARVRARVVVLRLPRNRTVASIRLGVVRTNRTIALRLPASVKLRTGRYLVRLHVVDPRGHTLRRSARYPGRVRIVVRRRPKRARPAPTPAPGPAAAAAPGGPAPVAGPGVFPVAGPFDFGGRAARFGASRTGHVHEGQDVTAAEGTPVVAPAAGTIARTSYQASGAGEYIVLDATDGRDYFFAHCQRRSTFVGEGVLVAAGHPLCRVGATGTTSGAPHLHFEIWLVGWRVEGGSPIDPLPQLRAWAAG